MIKDVVRPGEIQTVVWVGDGVVKGLWRGSFIHFLSLSPITNTNTARQQAAHPEYQFLGILPRDLSATNVYLYIPSDLALT
jgi:hypothetical protein